MSVANCLKDCGPCFYCGVTLSPRHEHDHFPTPARAGGEDVVPTCLNCHDFKDRVALGNWPAELVLEAFADAGPKGRVLIAKCAAIVANAQADAEERAA